MVFIFQESVPSFVSELNNSKKEDIAETNKTYQTKYNETLDLAKQYAKNEGNNWNDMTMEQQADYFKNACDKLGYDFEELWKYHLQQMMEKDAFAKLSPEKQQYIQEWMARNDQAYASNSKEESDKAWNDYKKRVPVLTDEQDKTA